VSDTEVARTFTVGHSTHEPARFVELLTQHGVRRLVDVRRFPGSRRMPHFSAESLSGALPEAGIAYEHRAELGGFRKPVAGSPNGGWRVKAFQGYADHMATAEFQAALAELIAEARRTPTAVMCAEAQWTRCHRRLLSDALLVRGFEVCHIRSDGRLEAHRLTPFAVVDGERIEYPPEQGSLDL
jgi:uncharacterized protein (DUF488 family)